MKLSELKTGMVVETRAHAIYLVANTEEGEKVLIREEGWNGLNQYNKDLTHKEFPEYDIMAVYKIKQGQSFKFIFDNSNLTLLWEREESIDYNTYVGKICKFWDNNYKKVYRIGIYKNYGSINYYCHESHESSYTNCELLTQEELEELGINPC